MFYFVQHLSTVTDSKRACERSCGAAAPLAAASAVNELQAAGLRLAPARQLVAGLNDNPATMMELRQLRRRCNCRRHGLYDIRARAFRVCAYRNTGQK